MNTSLLSHFRERGVLRIAAGYAVIAWLLLQMADVTFEPLEVPQWVMTSDRRGGARVPDIDSAGVVLRDRRPRGAA